MSLNLLPHPERASARVSAANAVEGRTMIAQRI
jgi:hypothetical protein